MGNGWGTPGREEKFRYYVKRGHAVKAAFKEKEDAEKWAEMTGGEVAGAPRNPRNAGRDPVYTPRETERICQRLAEGVPIRKIAEEIGCSVGHVHKLKSEQAQKEGQAGSQRGAGPRQLGCRDEF